MTSSTSDPAVGIGYRAAIGEGMRRNPGCFDGLEITVDHCLDAAAVDSSVRARSLFSRRRCPQAAWCDQAAVCGHRKWTGWGEKSKNRAVPCRAWDCAPKHTMRRHALITLLAGLVTASSLPCYAQQPANALIGFLSIGSSASSTFAPLKGAFIQGLNERGFIEGRNVAIEYRWAEGRYDRLPGLANELIARKVAVIVASGGLASAQQAKAATDTVPILFIASFDPVAVGLTNSMSHPSGNATGVTVNATELAQKRLEFLHRLVPTATTVGALVNPKSASGVVPKIEIARVEAAARLFGLKTVALEASSEAEIEAAFLRTEREGVDALTVSGDAFFTSQRALIVALAKKYRIPAVYPWREYVEAGGLASFGPTLRWAYHQVGLYAARILTGAKLSDMPVLSPTTFETTISRSTAEALGLRLERRLFALTSQYIEELQ